MNRRLDEVLVSFASIGLVIALDHFFKPTLTISIILAVAGAILLVFGERILDGQPNKIKTFFINILGIMLIVRGVQSVAELYAVDYWWVMGIAGLLLYSTHNWISERF